MSMPRQFVFPVVCIGVLGLSACHERSQGGASDISDAGVQHSEMICEPGLGESHWAYDELEFALVPPGEFIVGPSADEDVSRVPEVFLELEVHETHRIAESVYLLVHEVRASDYLLYLEESGHENRDFMVFAARLGEDGLDAPAVHVSKTDAELFCEWLTGKHGCIFRLPTNAEWEAACRIQSVPGAKQAPNNIAWVRENADSRLQAVMSTEPTGLGFYDLLGNAWEWTSSSMPEQILKQLGSDVDIFYIRGGSVDNTADTARCGALWAGWPADKRSEFVGFRVVVDRR